MERDDASLRPGARYPSILLAATTAAMVRSPSKWFATGALDSRGFPSACPPDFDWLLAQCVEFGGLRVHYCSPQTGDLTQIPRGMLWRGQQHTNEDTELGHAAEAFLVAAREAAADADVSWSDVVVETTQLDAALESAHVLYSAWLYDNLGLVQQRFRELEALPDGVDLTRLQSTEMQRADELLETMATMKREHEEPAPPTKIPSRQDRIRGLEAEFKRRWENQEFDSAKAATSALLRRVNTRMDGTLATRADKGYCSRATVERQTRGWFR